MIERVTDAVFGDSLDIHAGGIDLKFPHHNNEQVRRGREGGRRERTERENGES